MGPAQHFQIESSSLSTISFTVSSLPTPRSRFIVILRHAVRISISLCAVVAVLAKVQREDLFQGVDYQVKVLLDYSLVGDLVCNIVDKLKLWMVLSTSFATMYLCLKRDYTEESLLVLQSLGIQTSTSSPYYFMNPSTTFIPTTQIQDIVIHEAFKGFEVRFFLAVIVEGATEVVVVFPQLLPRRAILEEVWRGSRKCLYGGAS